MRLASKPWTASNETGRKDQGDESITDEYNIEVLCWRFTSPCVTGMLIVTKVTHTLQSCIWSRKLTKIHAYQDSIYSRSCGSDLSFLFLSTTWLSCKQPDTQSLKQLPQRNSYTISSGWYCDILQYSDCSQDVPDILCPLILTGML
jgi:hypothetical protein